MNFFGRKNRNRHLEATFEEQLAQQQVAPGTQLHYDSGLIRRLRDHHEALLELAGRTRDMTQASRFDDTRKCVRNFRLSLNEHLLEKNLRLYTYLNCCLQADPESLELIRNMRRETGDISRQSTRFIAHYEEVGVSEENRGAFLEELAQITALLIDRFAREERSLYTMYRLPQSYAGSATRRPPARSRPTASVSFAVAC